MADSKTRKKLFTEVTAFIAFEAPKNDIVQLVNHFLGRRGIELIGEVEVSGTRHVVASFKVKYRVHGGWRSDFIRKLEIDAKDLNIDIRNLEVTVDRREIPAECPRKDCYPCSVALDPSKAYQPAPPPPPESVPPKARTIRIPEPDTVDTRRRIFKFLGGNAK